MHSELWRLPVDTRQRFLETAQRAFRRKCPYCGGSGIYANYFTLREHCPTCGVRFEREDGYFLGAYALNLVVSEILGLGIALLVIFGTEARRLELIWQEALALALAVAFPLLFFPFSRGLWMALDLSLHPPATGGKRHAGDEVVVGNRDHRR